MFVSDCVCVITLITFAKKWVFLTPAITPFYISDTNLPTYTNAFYTFPLLPHIITHTQTFNSPQHNFFCQTVVTYTNVAYDFPLTSVHVHTIIVTTVQIVTLFTKITILLTRKTPVTVLAWDIVLASATRVKNLICLLSDPPYKIPHLHFCWYR